MLNPKNKKALAKRIHFIVGQLGAVEKMVDKGEDGAEIFKQLRSVEAAFRSSVLETFETAHRLELAEQIVQELEECPGSCQYCDLVDTLKRDFPKLSITQVLNGLHQLNGRKEGKRKRPSHES